MSFRPKSKEDDSLYRCAQYCYYIAGEVLEFLPQTRESQQILVKLLSGKLASSGESFPISAQFLADTVKCRDTHLLEHWKGSFENLAWLMVHEDLSNFFAKFVLNNWRVEPYIIHHVPKSAGTSLYELIHGQSYFITYPQTTFGAMCATSGLLGFASQLWEFEQECRHERIYLGGHFNLPNMLRSLGEHARCQGISLVRSPIETISSAIRYVWTLIEQKDGAWAPSYPSLAGQKLTEIRKSASRSPDPSAFAAMREVADTILRAPIFSENYEEILCKYYYNEKIGDPVALTSLFDEYRNIVPCIDMEHDAELIREQLRIEGEAPRVNVSLLSHRDLVRAFGGDGPFRAAVAAKILRSAEIYGALCVLNTRASPRAAAPLGK